MKRVMSIILIMGMIMFTVPAFALLDDNSTNNAGGSAVSRAVSNSSSNPVQNFSPDNRNTNTNLNSSSSSSRSDQAQGQIAAQGQGQLGIVSPSQDVNVGGDTNRNTAYVMTAPNTVAGAGQQASSLYSIFGGVNIAQTQEYQVCREKLDVIVNLKNAGFLTAEEAQAEATEVWNQLKDNTQVKRILWIGPKTRGVHLGNVFGLLAMDSCNEFNADNWLGVKNIKLNKKAE